ncbi:MAG: hypothetical protein QOI80_3690 [Solirubrobacteraceae bacterium]|nr:hypothetical protein [Solirubrobacteraceae bacterium]
MDRTPRRWGPLVLFALAALAAGVPLVRTVVGAPAAARPRHASLGIQGRAPTPLRPGLSLRLDLGLHNRRPFAVRVTRVRVRVRVDRRHRLAGCDTRRDFAVRQLPRRSYPIRLPARTTRSLSQLHVSAFPSVRMLNPPTRNQDACKGARLRLRYRARISRPCGGSPPSSRC